MIQIPCKWGILNNNHFISQPDCCLLSYLYVRSIIIIILLLWQSWTILSLYIGIAVHDEDQLCTEDLQEVVSHLMEAINVWFQLGLALGIRVATLEDIKCHTNHNRDGLREMLTHWLRTSPSRTWSDICNGLRSDTVKQNVLANTIEEKYNGKINVIFL